MNALRTGSILCMLLLSLVVLPAPAAVAGCTAAEVCYETETEDCLAWAQVGAPSPKEGTLVMVCVPECAPNCISGLCGDGVGVQGPQGCSELVGEPDVAPCEGGVAVRLGDATDLGCVAPLPRGYVDPAVTTCGGTPGVGFRAGDAFEMECYAPFPEGYFDPSVESCGVNGWTGVHPRLGGWWDLGCWSVKAPSDALRVEPCGNGVRVHFLGGWVGVC